MRTHRILACLGLLVTATPVAADKLRVEVGSPAEPRPVDLDRLLGGNVALWFKQAELDDPALRRQLDLWRPAFLRMPGGSWSDEIYWNGNGVREGDRFDSGKRSGHHWEVDYSGYSPGFRLAKADGTLADFHGHLDVRALHEFIQGRGAEAMVTVNAGTGTPQMAAEWVRWANRKQGYGVRYWEVGNELDGEWELGHVGPDGKVVDAAEYARRYLEFASAMKAVDPSIQVGGPTCSNDQLPFVEVLIRESGELLDFVSFHTYPVLGGGKSEAERFAHADDVKDAVARIRGWIRQYQPGREGEIEIGVTEWHKQVMETRPTVDLSSGLWACIFIGSMAEAGVDFAHQWDFFSDVGGGGHGLFGKQGEGPRAVFHAMCLWRQAMGGELLEVTGGDDALRIFATKATREGEDARVMFVNTSREEAREVELRLDGQAVEGRLAGQVLSQREYFWNPRDERPEWSRSPREVTMLAGSIVVPPFAALVLEVPADRVGKAELLTAEAGEAELDLVLPAEATADLPVEGQVLVRSVDDGSAWPGELGEVRIEVSGPAECRPTVVDTRSSVGRFQLVPSGPGESIVRVVAGDLSDERRIRWTRLKERDEVVWGFPDEASVAGLETNYRIELDPQARPNQTVAAVVLDEAVDEEQANTLLGIKPVSKKLPRERIGGIIGRLGASSDLECGDPQAFVQVVLQSDLDHWMVVGRVPLDELRGSWQELSIRLEHLAQLEAMAELYSIRFHLKSRSPVSGRIYFDDLGLILRGES